MPIRRLTTSGTPGPVHLDLAGVSGHVISDGEADLDVIIEELPVDHAFILLYDKAGEELVPHLGL